MTDPGEIFAIGSIVMRKMVLLFAALLLSACFDDGGKVIRLSGNTMGTTYSVVAVNVPEYMTHKQLSDAVEATLARVNASMSNWDPASEVTIFNEARHTSRVKISPDFARVMAGANRVHELSEGKFDVTLGPLIDLWGFGAKKPGDPIPADADIAAALDRVGQADLLELDEATLTLRKTDPEVSINLSGIAKGFGADAVAATLSGMGVEQYLVEIGGDLVTRGVNDRGEPWVIGIERPDPGSGAVEMIVPVSDLGMATSGDYRNFFEQDGVRYSHLLDPTTGRPITHRATSVTVLAENAMMADALATAMIVLGDREGMRIAEEQGLAVFFISRNPKGYEPEFVTATSTAFENYRNRH